MNNLKTKIQDLIRNINRYKEIFQTALKPTVIVYLNIWYQIFEKKTLKNLQKQYKNVKGDKRTKINELLGLYESGNIHNKVTVQHLISQLLTPTNDPQKQLVKYYQSMVKYLTNTPNPVARQQQKQEVKPTDTKRTNEEVIDKLDKKSDKKYI